MGRFLSLIKGLLTIGSLIKAWQSIPLGHQVELDVTKIFWEFFSLPETNSKFAPRNGWLEYWVCPEKGITLTIGLEPWILFDREGSGFLGSNQSNYYLLCTRKNLLVVQYHSCHFPTVSDILIAPNSLGSSDCTVFSFSGKLTWPWKMDPLKMYFLLKLVIFHCHVSLPEGTDTCLRPDMMFLFCERPTTPLFCCLQPNDPELVDEINEGLWGSQWGWFFGVVDSSATGDGRNFLHHLGCIRPCKY